MGDSQAEAFIAYKVLDDLEMIAHKGAHIKDVNSEYDKIVNLNPKNIFLTYGVNDLGMYGTKEKFIAVAHKVIQDLQAGLPETKIYVNLIFPVTSGNRPAVSFGKMGNCLMRELRRCVLNSVLHA